MLFKFRPLVVNPELAVRVGLNEAIVLQQLNYWIVDREAGVEHDGKRWVYNTLEQWRKQFPFWSVETVKRTLSSLHKEGLIHVEQLNKRQHDRTNFYTINFKHKHLIDESKTAPIEEVNLTRSSRAECPSLHTEITTETTSTSLTAPSAPNVRGTQKSSQIDEQFEAAWKAYPPRSGSRSKVKAKEAWNARRKEGVSAEDMMQGVIRYAAYCTVKGSIGTEYVMQAQRFFGKGREYENDWAASAAPASAGQSRHAGFDQRDYTSGLILREDGTHAF